MLLPVEQGCLAGRGGGRSRAVTPVEYVCGRLVLVAVLLAPERAVAGALILFWAALLSCAVIAECVR